jgi:hypothetical protein
VVQRFCGHPQCTNPSCHDRRNHPPTPQDVTASLDPLAELRRASETSRARFDFQAQGAAALPAHLTQRVDVRGTERSMAEVTSPHDRLLLAAQERDPTGHYAQLQQRPSESAPPIVAGRLQDPPDDNRPRERFIYAQGGRGAPSYPSEAGHLGSMIGAGSSSSQVFGQVARAMTGEPLGTTDEREQRHLMTTANIVGIAEQRRDPFMGLTSAQTIVDASTPGSTLTPAEVFGRRSAGRGGRSTNLPGILPASGTGATGEFRAFQQDLGAGRMPASDSGRRLFENISAQHARLGEQGIDEAAMGRLHAEGMDREFILQSQAARARSAATREAAYMTGQLRYRLRSLRGRPHSTSQRFSPY